MHRKIGLLLVMSWIPVLVGAQNAHQLLRNGDREYYKGEYKKAEESYRKSLAQSGSANGYFNLGNSVYRQERFPEAVKQFEQAVRKAPTAAKKADAYYNLGNAHFEAGNLDKSIEAYKNALRSNPSDIASKYNLALAKKKLQQQQPPPPPPSSSGAQQPPPSGAQPPQQSGQPPQQPTPRPESEQQPSAGQQLSREEAEALLRIAGQEEKKVQSKMRKDPGTATKHKKDW
jgi:Ca-activated chloride channel family protein